jgi:multimeric flavodoxin WrbA
LENKKMKILAVSGSPRKGGNTELLLQVALDKLAADGFETELLSLAGRPVRGCTACGVCRKNNDVKCVIPDPAFEGIVEKFIAADGILIGSPVYFGSATPEIMAVLDRVGYVTRSQKLLRRKVGASMAVGRRAGMNFTFAQLNYFFLPNEMIVPGSTYWNVARGAAPGEVLDDEEGVETIKTLAENMGWLLKQLNPEG